MLVLRHQIFFIASNSIEFVEKWPHLGHMISLNLSDDTDISHRKQSLVGQINSVFVA